MILFPLIPTSMADMIDIVWMKLTSPLLELYSIDFSGKAPSYCLPYSHGTHDVNAETHFFNIKSTSVLPLQHTTYHPLILTSYLKYAYILNTYSLIQEYSSRENIPLIISFLEKSNLFPRLQLNSVLRLCPQLQHTVL